MGTYPGGTVLKLSPTMDTDAYGATDLLFDKQELKNAVGSRGAASLLQNISVFDNTATDVDMGILFFDNATSLGADANDAVTNISDAEFQAAGFIGAVELNFGEIGFATANGSIYTSPGNTDKRSGLPLLLQAPSGSTSIWVAAVTLSGTPAYAADSLDFTFNIQYLG